MIDIVVIGYGPAGISAALYLKRAGLNVTVIGKDDGALSNHLDNIDNYYGLQNPIDGKSLIQVGIQQAESLDIEIIHDFVIALYKKENYFEVKTSTTTLRPKAVVLATGKDRKTLPIKGFNKFNGKGISLCAQCNGYFFRKKKIAVIGCGAYMAHELEFLSSINQNITILTDGNALEVDVDFPVIPTKIKSFVGENKLSGIETTDGQIHDFEGAFIALGAPSSLSFASQLGIVTEKGDIVVNDKYETNIEGLFAIGDMIGGKLQIAKAVYDGMMVSDHIKSYLKK